MHTYVTSKERIDVCQGHSAGTMTRFASNGPRKYYILRTSPIPGPPKTLMSSLLEPPLSLMGITLPALASTHGLLGQAH